MIRLARTLIFPALALLLVSTRSGWRPVGRLPGGRRAWPGEERRLDQRRRGIPLGGGPAAARQDLAKHHGFTCTVLFAIGKDGTIEPNRNDNIPGLEALRKADLMIIATRFRDLPEDQMKEIDDYVQSGRPVIGMRTATHAFNIKGGKRSTPVTRSTARSGTAASAARCSARRGSATTAITVVKARAG